MRSDTAQPLYKRIHMTAARAHHTDARGLTLAVLVAIATLLTSATLTGCSQSANAAITERSSVPVRNVPGKVEGEEVAVLTAAPNVPPPITRTHRPKSSSISR